MSTILLRQIADAAYPESMVLDIFLCCLRQTIPKYRGCSAVVFQMDAEKPAFPADVQQDDPLVLVLFHHIFNGIIQRVSKQNVQVLGVQKGQVFMIHHVGQRDPGASVCLT